MIPSKNALAKDCRGTTIDEYSSTMFNRKLHAFVHGGFSVVFTRMVFVVTQPYHPIPLKLAILYH